MSPVLRIVPVALAACACASSGGLDRSLGHGGAPRDVDVESVAVHGHEVYVMTDRPSYSGELFAVDAHDVWVLEDGDRLTPVPRRKVAYVDVELYESAATATALWTVLGTLSTVTHGGWLILTGPTWIATGTTASVVASSTNDLRVERDQLDALYQFARFPQGLPRRMRESPPPPPARAPSRFRRRR